MTGFVTRDAKRSPSWDTNGVMVAWNCGRRGNLAAGEGREHVDALREGDRRVGAGDLV